MNISVNQTQGRVPVAVLSVQGDLDASNYQELIAKAKELYNMGMHQILLDLSNTSFVSSSGLVAIHSIALLLHGEQPPDLEQGWSAIHAVEHGLGVGSQRHLKLLNPQPKVDRTLEKAGLKEFFEIHADLAAAIASF
jgi:anti-anti-sigma regulatory factor